MTDWGDIAVKQGHCCDDEEHKKLTRDDLGDMMDLIIMEFEIERTNEENIEHVVPLVKAKLLERNYKQYLKEHPLPLILQKYLRWKYP